MKKPIQVRVEEADLAAWKKRAEEAGLDLSGWIRERCNQDDQDVRGVPGVSVDGRSASAPRGHKSEPSDARSGEDVLRRVPSPVADVPAVENSTAILDAVVSETKTRRKADDSIEAAVAARNPGHAVGCDCLHCTQTYRFIEQQRKDAEKKEEPKKKGRR
jgi:hypothetical protein